MLGDGFCYDSVFKTVIPTSKPGLFRYKDKEHYTTIKNLTIYCHASMVMLRLLWFLGRFLLIVTR